jgi:carbonic anhydrase/acetyltransferase-like protein (isoleucine patch superfamily)
MRAIIIETGRLLSPYDEPPDRITYAESTMRAVVERALTRRGFTIARIPIDAPPPNLSEPTLVLADHTFVSEKALGDFLEKVAFGREKPARLALCRTPSSDYTRPVSSVVTEPLDAHGDGARPEKAKGAEADASERIAYDCFFVPAGTGIVCTSGRELLAKLRDAPRVVVQKREIGIAVRLPLLGDPERTTMIFPVTSTVCAHVEHWVHALWLNHLAFGIRWNEIAREQKLFAAGVALRAFPFTRERALKAAVWKGKGVVVHKTAYVEGSILSDGVVVGPRATVRNSILGPGVEVGDHASVLACTVGARTYVTPKSFFVWSTAMEDAVINNLKMQMCLVGRGASSSVWAGLIDAKFQGGIEVLHDGKLSSTERSFLGSCLGHESFVGAKVLIHPGREIPNGTFIAMRHDELVRTIPADMKPGVPMVRHEGTLVPLDSLVGKSKATA